MRPHRRSAHRLLTGCLNNYRPRQVMFVYFGSRGYHWQPDERKQLHNLFDACDLDETGRVSLAELERTLLRFGLSKLKPEDLKRLFDGLEECCGCVS